MALNQPIVLEEGNAAVVTQLDTQRDQSLIAHVPASFVPASLSRADATNKISPFQESTVERGDLSEIANQASFTEVSGHGSGEKPGSGWSALGFCCRTSRLLLKQTAVVEPVDLFGDGQLESARVS